MKQFLVILTLLIFTLQGRVQAQSEEGEGDENERVQYALILPEEKAPEMVKPEENNPFEAASEGRLDTEGNTEENQVRDLLLGMSVGGAVSGSRGMRVMLGGMRLEAGMVVPPIIPDQQVSLRVKSITPEAIELVWVEKKPTGLPPKTLVISIDGSPRVRYRMPAGSSAPGGQGTMGTMRHPEVSAFSPPRQEAEPSVAKAERVEEKKVPSDTTPPPASKSTTPPPSNVPEASVLRMLFGNHGPEPK